jgi:hypothetical protein
MKKRPVKLSASIIFGFVVCLVMTVFAQEDIVEVADSIFSGKKIRPPVPFHHEAHNEKAKIYECNVCHHVWEDGKKLEYETSEEMECSECHYDPTAAGYPMDVIKAYHDNCKGCHLQKKAGPIQCSECHVKQ